MNRQAGGLVAVAAICAVGGFLLYRSSHVGTSGAATSPAVTAKAADAITADEPAGQAVPEQVPDIRLQDLQGKLRSLKEFSGQPTIINFWATWCVPCRREIPLLNELYRGRDRQQLQIVGIAVDFRDAVQSFIKKTAIDYPLLVGEQDGVDAAAKFGMQLVLPFSIFVDDRQRIVAVKVGELHKEEAAAILAAITDLGAGKQDLPATRQHIAEELKRLATERARDSTRPS